MMDMVITQPVPDMISLPFGITAFLLTSNAIRWWDEAVGHGVGKKEARLTFVFSSSGTTPGRLIRQG